MDNPIRILIVDDDALFRQTIRTLLENADGVMAVGEAKDGQEATALVRELRPDVVLLDVDGLRSNSLQALVRIRELSPDSKIVMLSVQGQEHLVFDALRKGAHGHLVKGESTPLEIVEALRAVTRGESVLSPHMAGWILDEIVQEQQYQVVHKRRSKRAHI
jgi:DNA-binding NarL/FixJ family response regulator